MVLLRVAGIAEQGDLEDEDTRCTWLEAAHTQLAQGVSDLSTVEEGDILALWDRDNVVSEEWRRVFVLMCADRILLFDEEGHRIDDPDNFTPDGVQSF